MKWKEVVRGILNKLGKSEAEIDELLKDAKVDDDTPQTQPLDASKISDPALKQIVETLNAQVGALNEQNKTLLATLNAEKNARDAAVKTQQEQIKSQRDKQIADALKSAEDKGQLAKADVPQWQKLLEADFDTSGKILAALPVKPGFKPANETAGKKQDGTQQTQHADTSSTSMKNYFDNKKEFNAAAMDAFKSTSTSAVN